MDSTRYSRAKETLKKQNTRSGNRKVYKAHARGAEAKSSRARTSSGPSPLEEFARHSETQKAQWVSIAWEQQSQPNRVKLVWQERGGPMVSPPKQKGFGSHLIERAFAGATG